MKPSAPEPPLEELRTFVVELLEAAMHELQDTGTLQRQTWELARAGVELLQHAEAREEELRLERRSPSGPSE